MMTLKELNDIADTLGALQSFSVAIKEGCSIINIDTITIELLNNEPIIMINVYEET